MIALNFVLEASNIQTAVCCLTFNIYENGPMNLLEIGFFRLNDMHT